MKKLFLLAAIPTLFVISGCGTEEEPKVENETGIPAGWVELDLAQPNTSYGLSLLINIPDEATAQGLPELMEGAMGGTQIRIGKDFNMEILPGSSNMAIKKEEIANDVIFKSTYIIDDPDFIFYKSEIEDAGIKQFHFYGTVKVGTGTYEVEDIKGEDYTESGVKKMIEAAKSLREKPQV